MYNLFLPIFTADQENFEQSAIKHRVHQLHQRNARDTTVALLTDPLPHSVICWFKICKCH